MVKELKDINPDGFYTVNETAALLGIHPNTVRNYNKRGILESCKRPKAGCALYRGKEISRFFYTVITV